MYQTWLVLQLAEILQLQRIVVVGMAPRSVFVIVLYFMCRLLCISCVDDNVFHA